MCISYLLGLDPTPCHTGWALYDRADGQFTYGVFEPPKTVTEDLPRMEYMLEEVFGLLPPDPGFDAKTIFVVIEGLAFNGRGSYALQLAGLGYMLRREFRNREIAYREVAPTQAKKFLTGKGNCGNSQACRCPNVLRSQPTIPSARTGASTRLRTVFRYHSVHKVSPP